MSNDKVRAEFEKWYENEMVAKLVGGGSLLKTLLWSAWQASQDSVEVELPSLPPKGVTSYDARKAACDMHARFRLAIADAGVRVKGNE